MTNSKRERASDVARRAILDAAEAAFADYGFAGARIDGIASASGYNKSMIFHYFGDKVGLYAAVIRRADTQMHPLQTQAVAALFHDDTILNATRFKAVLRTYMRAYFDFLVDHPRFMRILRWEMADDWHAYAQIVSQREREDLEQFTPLVEKVQQAGLLRTDFDPVAQVTMVQFNFLSYLAVMSLHQILQPDQDFSSAAALKRARDYAVEFAVQGLVVDPAQETPATDGDAHEQ